MTIECVQDLHIFQCFGSNNRGGSQKKGAEPKQPLAILQILKASADKGMYEQAPGMFCLADPKWIAVDSESATLQHSFLEQPQPRRSFESCQAARTKHLVPGMLGS